MKKYIITAFAAIALSVSSCVNLDLYPLSEGSSENWYSNEQEITLALNALYARAMWNNETTRLFNTDRFTDDWSQRTQLYDWVGGTIDSSTGSVATEWSNYYKGIARANTILYSMNKATDLSPALVAQYTGEAKFFRACFYSYLITLFGDVPYYDNYITLEQAYEMGRVDRKVVLQHIYQDFDDAAEALPVSYTGMKRVTKGAALAMKARTALWMNDWKTCAAASKACMDLGVYELHPDYGELFKSSTKNSKEVIFALPSSNDLGVHAYGEATTRNFYPRLNGGTSVAQPSWNLLLAFPCTDGKFIGESPLYDPANFFKNRDPRLSEVTAPFDEEFMSYVYNPRPSATNTLNTVGETISKISAADQSVRPTVGANGHWWVGTTDSGVLARYTGTNGNVWIGNHDTGKSASGQSIPTPSVNGGFWAFPGVMVKNTDCKPGSKDCSYNGFVLKKFVDEEWIDDRLTDTPMRIIRYADVLLMYAESKMEMNEIDASVFNAINQIRARAYKCGVDETSKYPAVTETNQTALRKIIRNERRIELCWENRRWFDLIRWRMCEEVLGPGTYVYGLPANAQSATNEKTGYWPFPKDFRPKMRPDSSIDMSDLENYPDYFTHNAERGFVTRQYLYPIPIKERTICPALTQNPGY